MINELKVSGAYLVKGFRKWSIWKAITRYHRFTQPEDSTFPSPQAAQLQHVTTKYCFVTILSAENILLQFVTISFESFFFSFFHCHSLTFAPPCSASLSAQAAVMGRLPSRLQWQSVSGLPGCSAADGFQVAFSMFQHKKSRWNRLPMETMSHSSTCSLPATLMFFTRKLTAFSGIGWNSILRKACENASDPVWLTEHPTCFTRLLAQGTDAKIWRKAQMASGCHPFTRHAKIQ